MEEKYIVRTYQDEIIGYCYLKNIDEVLIFCQNDKEDRIRKKIEMVAYKVYNAENKNIVCIVTPFQTKNPKIETLFI
jgi:hypothetical protein